MNEFLKLAGWALIILAIAFCLNGFGFVHITHLHNEAGKNEGGKGDV